MMEKLYEKIKEEVGCPVKEQPNIKLIKIEGNIFGLIDDRNYLGNTVFVELISSDELVVDIAVGNQVIKRIEIASMKDEPGKVKCNCKQTVCYLDCLEDIGVGPTGISFDSTCCKIDIFEK